MGLFSKKSIVPTPSELAGEDLGLAFHHVAALWGAQWRRMLQDDFGKAHCSLAEQFCADLVNFLQVFKGSAARMPTATLLLTLQIFKKLEPSDFGKVDEVDFVKEYFRLETLPSEADIPNSVALFEDYQCAGKEHPALLCASLFIRYLQEIISLDVSLRNTPVVIISKQRLEAFCKAHTPSPLPLPKDSQQPYDLLGVSPGCTDEELKAAYNECVKRWHPDRLQEMAPELLEFANERLSAINVAYTRLKAESRRLSNTVHTKLAESTGQPDLSDYTQARKSARAHPDVSMHESLEAEEAPAGTGSPFFQSASANHIAWRITKAILRAVWSFFKIALTAVLGALGLALVILAAVVHLAAYWKNEADSETRPLGALRNFSMIYMLSEFLGLPMLVVRAILFACSTLLLLLMVAGHFMWSAFVAHIAVSLVLILSSGIAIFVWLCKNEMAVEFAPDAAETRSSLGWVMGALITVLTGLSPFYLPHTVRVSYSEPGTAPRQTVAPVAFTSKTDIQNTTETGPAASVPDKPNIPTKLLVVVGSLDLLRPVDTSCEVDDCWWELDGSHGIGAQDGWVMFANPKPKLKVDQLVCIKGQFPIGDGVFLTNDDARSHYPRLVAYRVPTSDETISVGVYEATSPEATCAISIGRATR